ncbi:MAG: cellulase family glycosylhydrolase [Methylotenera sp.]|nr:cellulase family glycosylhydrolase [Methylotenera sp.]
MISLLNLAKSCISGMILILITATQCHAESTWLVSINEEDGLPQITRGGGSAVASSFIFFDKNWSWTYLDRNFKIDAPGKYSLTGMNKALGFNLDATISKNSPQQLIWDFRLDAKNSRNDVTGGGITFKFDIANLQNELGDPEILPDKSGWGWGKGESRIEMHFKPKPADIFFERGSKSELRAYLYSGNIPAGKLSYKATLTLPASIIISPTLTERFGTGDSSKWTKNILDGKISPVDLTFLNEPEKPAGKRGFLKAKGEKLIFEDGTTARFWGTNLSAYTLFGTSKDMVKLHSKRLSSLGYNLVRIHHYDSLWVDPNIFGLQASSTKTISSEAMDKLDWWIKCLKDEGIYIWLDMHVERQLKPDDNITAYNEISKGRNTADLKGYNYVNKSIQQAMKDFNAEYLGHRNSYTHIRYLDEPAIAAVLITNENDITNHFGNALLPDKNVDFHSKIYMNEAEKFAKANNLSKAETWRSWEHGPSKLFLNDLEHRFNSEMISQLRQLGVKVPIVTTSTWGENPISSLPALSSGDMIDAHAYQPYGALEKNPLFAPNFTHWLASAQVIGKPMSVTEWNAEPFPTADRHTLPLYIASQASQQGWDAMMHYAYSQEKLEGAGSSSNWHAYNDPAMLALMPAAGLMYRRGDLKESNITYIFNPGKDALFNQNISPNNSIFLRTAAEFGKLMIAMPAVKELPWLQKSIIPSDAIVINSPGTAISANRDARKTSTSNLINRNWEKGYLTINSENTQAAMGWIGGEKLTLSDVVINTSTQNAVVAIQSTDNLPISKSKNIVISLAARSMTEVDRKLPYLSEPVEGSISINAPKGLKLFTRDKTQQKKIIPFLYKNGQYVITLDKSLATYWLFMTE